MSDEKRWYWSSNEEEWDCIESFATRDEAIAAGREADIGTFWVAEGEPFTEKDVAGAMRDILESAYYSGEVEEIMEVASEEPIVNIAAEDWTALEEIVASWVKERKLLERYINLHGVQKID